jgi:NAD(P)-dependent dehydrogenase (short-subunit alcohol dehydrogenase family)
MTAPSLDSFPDGLNALIFGASGGIGGALTSLLAQHPRVATLHAGSHRADVQPNAKVRPFRFGHEDETTIAAAVEQARADGPLHMVIVATGMLHDETRGITPEKTWRHLSADTMARSFAVNAVLPGIIAKHALPALAKGDKAVFAALTARVGSISDNRLGGWHAYRAAKAALNQLIRTLSVELAAKNPSALCVGLHPGTVATAMSAPFQGNVPGERLFSPEQSAASLLSVLNALSPQGSGRAFAWDGSEIQP